MRGPSNIAVAAWLAATLAPAWAGAQSVERIDVYRDAAVVTWNATLDAGQMAPVARSFSSQTDGVVILTEPGDLEVVATKTARLDWRTPDVEVQMSELEGRLEGLQLDLSLKSAQLDLVEEDLALLRENRRIGGTAEAVLVEDIEDVSEWMHAAFREALYRRVELREEVAALQAELEVLNQKVSGLASREATVHHVEPSEAGTVWSQTVEWDAGWSPADAVTLEAGAATWSQRVAYHFSAPVDAAVNVVFVDGNWADANSVAAAETSMGYERKAKKASVGRRLRLDAPRHPAPNAVQVSGSTRGEVHLNTFRRDVVAQFHGIPAQWEGIMMTVSVAEGEARVLTSSELSLRLPGQVPRWVGWTSRADSLHIDAGQVANWTVRRDVEPGLCNRSALGNRIHHRRAFAMEVSNRSDAAGSVMLVEPLPRNRALEIEVNPDELDGGVLDEKREQLVWQFTLQPGESRTLRFAYDVSHDREVPTPDWD